MNQLSQEKRELVVKCLVDGNSIRATVRITGVAKNTVTKLLVDLGKVCESYHCTQVHHVEAKRVQVDEIWSFVGCKAKNVSKERAGEPGLGDAWTWMAIDADSKLVISYLVGGRDASYAGEFMQDVAERLANRVQLTSDGLGVYLQAVDDAFNGDIDYAMLVKIYGPAADSAQHRYSPPKCNGSKKQIVRGMPEREHVSTSYVERLNLTSRMSMRRFTRLTNGFSKKLENLRHAVSLHFMYYNFCRVHQTIKTTPAVAAGLAKQPWTVSDLISLLDGPQKHGGWAVAAAS